MHTSEKRNTFKTYTFIVVLTEGEFSEIVEV
jgi:hypothetical protein